MTRTKTRIERTRIEDVIFDESLDLRIYTDYSGRGMYGETCFGIVGSAAEVSTFLAAIGRAMGDEGIALARKATYDSMGRSEICYFPGYEVGGDDEEDE